VMVTSVPYQLRSSQRTSVAPDADHRVPAGERDAGERDTG